MGPTAPCRSEGRRLQISHKTGSSRGHLLSARPGQCTSPPCWEPPAGASHGRARGILALTPVASVASHLFRLFCTSVGSLRPQDPHGSWVPRSIATGQGVRVQGRAVWPSSRLLLELLLGGYSLDQSPTQEPGSPSVQPWSRGGRYLGSSRLGVESRLQYLYLPEPQFPHPKNRSNKTHLRKLGQDPGHRDNFLTFKIPAKRPPTDLGGKKTASGSTTWRDTGAF